VGAAFGMVDVVAHPVKASANAMIVPATGTVFMIECDMAR